MWSTTHRSSPTTTASSMWVGELGINLLSENWSLLRWISTRSKSRISRGRRRSNCAPRAMTTYRYLWKKNQDYFCSLFKNLVIFEFFSYENEGCCSFSFPGSGDVLHGRVLEVPQAYRLLHRPRRAVHSLETDRLLFPGRKGFHIFGL